MWLLPNMYIGIGLEEIPLLQEAIDNGTFPLRSYAMVSRMVSNAFPNMAPS